ncbi:hypothetical protein IG631_07322 [Alternaria alternata]|nr:hypothetical protein IG631_07322 [Alternaria alternata]
MARVTSRSQATLSRSWRLYPALRSVAQGWCERGDRLSVARPGREPETAHGWGE